MASSTKAGVTTSYAFDGLGRMTTAGAAAFTYDGLDRVYQRAEGAVTSTFGYAGEESDPINDGTNTYSRAAGRLLGVKNGVTRLAAGSNSHGDITHLFNPTAANVPTRRFLIRSVSPAGATGATPNRIGFQGDWTDPTTKQVVSGGDRGFAIACLELQGRDGDSPKTGSDTADSQKNASAEALSSESAEAWCSGRRAVSVGRFCPSSVDPSFPLAMFNQGFGRSGARARKEVRWALLKT